MVIIVQAQSVVAELQELSSARSQVPSSFYGCGDSVDFLVRGAVAASRTSATGLPLLAAARVVADGVRAAARLQAMSTMSRNLSVPADTGITMMCGGQLGFIEWILESWLRIIHYSV